MVGWRGKRRCRDAADLRCGEHEDDEAQGGDDDQAAQVAEKLDEIGWVADEGDLAEERDEVKLEGEEEEPGAAEREQRTGGQGDQPA